METGHFPGIGTGGWFALRSSSLGIVRNPFLEEGFERQAAIDRDMNAPALTIMIDRDGRYWVGSDAVPGEGIDVLFVTGGLAADQFGPDIESPDAELLDTWLAARQQAPQFAVGRQR